MTNPLRIKVHGLDCADEVAVLRREVGPLVGGEDRLSFDVLGGIMTVHAATLADPIIEAVSRTGMRAEIVSESGPSSGLRLHDDRRERIRLTFLSGSFVAAGF
ncbi:MAG: heavy metal translocating P-type ATPase, partial [Candidatus Eisenbacteria bacterium]